MINKLFSKGKKTNLSKEVKIEKLNANELDKTLGGAGGTTPVAAPSLKYADATSPQLPS
jgi:hypothetical protein